MSIKSRTISGVIWTSLQRFSVQFVSLFVQIILARLLVPEDFGLIAMTQIVITIGQTLMDSGMTSSLIRTREPDEKDYSTVFTTNLIVSLAIYAAIYFAAPSIATFFNQVLLTDLIRVYALAFIIQAFTAVHIARLTKLMNFKLQMILQLPATLLGGACGVAMAYLGYGVWSLVALHLVMTLSLTIMLWTKAGWHPAFMFDKARFKNHFNFGYKMTLSSLLTNVYSELYPLLIGKIFAPAELGFYKQAHSLRMFPVSNITSALHKVTYPLFSELQNDDTRLKSVFQKITFLVFFITTPIMLCSIVIADPLFEVLLTDKWLPAVPYFQILCVAAIAYPLSMYNLNIIAAKGLSGLHLRLELLKKSLSIACLILLLPFGMYGVVSAAALGMVIGAVINCYCSGRLINYSLWSQIKHLLPIFILAVVVAALSYFMMHVMYSYVDSQFIVLVGTSVWYFCSYLFIAILFRINGVGEMYELLRHVARKRSNKK